MENQNEIDYEHLPAGMPMDETDVNLRAYLSRLSPTSRIRPSVEKSSERK
jgi:hypothetical protein